MSKRKLDEEVPKPKLDEELEADWAESKNKPKTDVIKKNSLDSDEDDDGEEKNYNILDEDEIEGQEEGAANMEGEVRITPFNMKEELEEGHFDTDGNYHWNKEKVVRDNWLENIDWVKIKKPAVGKAADDSEDSDDSDNIVTPFDCVPDYKRMLELMKPGETVAKAIQRLGAGKTLTASERWKRKKAGQDVDSPGQLQVAALTEHANNLLTRTGNMDIYQESFEHITKAIAATEMSSVKALLSASTSASDVLDMYADDFDSKEKARCQTDQSDEPVAKKARVEGEEPLEGKVLRWEFKWSKGSSEVHGPHSSAEMQAWVDEGFFKKEVWVRKCGQEGDFYTSQRIDFQLYL